MYAFLARHLPRPLANAVAIVWYAVLLALIYALWSAPQAVLRYVNM